MMRTVFPSFVLVASTAARRGAAAVILFLEELALGASLFVDSTAP
jgi:hypothetical protein